MELEEAIKWAEVREYHWSDYERERFTELVEAARKYAAIAPLLHKVNTLILISHRGNGWNEELENTVAEIKKVMDD